MKIKDENVFQEDQLKKHNLQYSLSLAKKLFEKNERDDDSNYMYQKWTDNNKMIGCSWIIVVN